MDKAGNPATKALDNAERNRDGTNGGASPMAPTPAKPLQSAVFVPATPVLRAVREDHDNPHTQAKRGFLPGFFFEEAKGI